MAFEFTDEELQVFDENQRTVLLGFQEKVNEEIESIRTNPQSEDEDDRFAHIPTAERPFYTKDEKKFKRMLEVWKSNGRIPGRKDVVDYRKSLCDIDRKHTAWMRDNLTSTDHPLLIPRVISEVVKEAIEPNIVLTPLLTRINYTFGTQLTFPAVGALTAADIAEGEEYPERSLDFAGQVVATIGKSGVAIKMTDEMIRYSMYDVMSMHLRAAGRAMIRWKERKVADLIVDSAGGTNTLYDNTSHSYSSTTGRDAEGNYNGTLSLDDIFRAYATMVTRGFIPNMLIMNPFAWQIFADEALARAFGFQHGQALWQMMQGAPGSAPQWSNGAGFGNGLLQNTQVDAPKEIATSFTNVPNIFPYPFRIVITPYMPYNTTTNVTDIIMCDASELGVLVVDEEIITEAWDDPARDIQKVKLRERYGLGAVNNGQGLGLIKGVSTKRGFDFAHNIQTNIDVTGLGDSLTGDSGYTAIPDVS